MVSGIMLARTRIANGARWLAVVVQYRTYIITVFRDHRHHADNGDSLILTERPHHCGNTIVLYWIHTYIPIKASSQRRTPGSCTGTTPHLPVLNTLHHRMGSKLYNFYPTHRTPLNCAQPLTLLRTLHRALTDITQTQPQGW